MTLFDKCFITGCDENTEWMLPWFVENYKKYNDIPLVFADFGVSLELKNMLSHLGFDHIIDMRTTVADSTIGNPKKLVNWFKKPKAMVNCSKISNYSCWIDSDIEVLADMSNIFSYVIPNKIGMVQDHPWSKRMMETWHNSGIVAFKDCPAILDKWAWYIEKGNHGQRGDQEVLHAMINSPLNRMIHITDIPNEYNWLRIQFEHDDESSKKAKAIHWTGRKGKERIMNKMGMQVMEDSNA